MTLVEAVEEAIKSRSAFVSFSMGDRRKELEFETEWMDSIWGGVRLRHRAFVILNGIDQTSYPRCKCGCGLPAGLNQTDHSKGFREYHNNAHSGKVKKLPSSIHQKLDDREWLYSQRIELMRSIDDIAQELGCSTIPVASALDSFGIKFDAKRRNLIGNGILSDKETLRKMYFEEGKTFDQIASEIGSSKATVSVHFKRHELTAKSSNQYTRTIKRASGQELALLEYVRGLTTSPIIHGARGVIAAGELDIYIPSAKFAIEYNGLFHHRFRPDQTNYSLRKDSSYHLTKTEQCEALGIRLIHIFSDEWVNTPDIVKSVIAQKLGRSQRKVHARKCDVRPIYAHVKNRFLNENHLQGEDRSSVKLGLFHGAELVSVMTFGKSRYNRGYVWELVRFAVKQNTSVAGAFSKLLSAFRREFNGSIVSYADRRYSDGGVYSKNGFKLISVNRPAYHYIKPSEELRHNRMKFQKKNLTDDPSDPRTELELAMGMGYFRVYDCGSLTYAIE